MSRAGGSGTARALVFWTNAGTHDAAADDGAIMAAMPRVGRPITLFSGRQEPEGIARLGDDLYWTERFGHDVLQGATTGDGPDVSAVGMPAPLTGTRWASHSTASPRPRTSSAGPTRGSSGRATEGSPASAPASTRRSSRRICRHRRRSRSPMDGSGDAVAVYWATFEGGSIFRADLAGGGALTPVEVAGGEVFPNGIAVDAESFTGRTGGTAP